MKRFIMTLTVVLAAAAMVMAFSSPESAWAVTGQCDNCHTMHYSQGGTALAAWGTDGPYGKLLTNDCMGCHTTPTSGDPFDGTTPFVAGTNLDDDACLAGGFFPAAAAMGTGNNNDNHHGVSASQTNLPAGFVAATGFDYSGATDGLGCAGINGCHGNETDTNDLEALSGGHHDVSAAYRMLYDADENPVEGSGAEDYEELIIKTPGTTPDTEGAGQNVNIYCAGAPTDGSHATISELCEKCHGDFHGTGNTGSASPWERHPTENTIPTTWTIGDVGYTPNGYDYKNNPVGYDAFTIDLDEKRVHCLSCHRAHGTANNDLLRWAYSTQIAGGGGTNGCLGCHDAQRN